MGHIYFELNIYFISNDTEAKSNKNNSIPNVSLKTIVILMYAFE